MRFGSVCSGIEAASVAWHPLGWQAAWLSEIEPFPSAVLKHHYPNVPNLGDMTALPSRIRSGEVEAPDLFCGGTPCQAFSVAGLRKSLDDARGNLSLTFCEIANAIDDVRRDGGKPASIVFWENVPGVLNTKDNAFGCFLAGLAGEDEPLEPPGKKWTDAGVVFGPQRTVAWRVYDAQHFQLAQRRKRVFAVASARADFDPAAVLFEFEGVRRDSAPSREAGQRVAPTIAGCANGGGANGPGRDVDSVESLQVISSGQANAEVRTDGGAPTLTCLHEAPIVAHALTASRSSTQCPNEDTTLVPVAFTQNQRDEVRTLEVAGALAAEPGMKQQTYIAQPAIAWDEELNASVEQAGTLLRGGQGGRHDGVAVPMINMQGSKGNAVAQADGPSFTLNAMHGHDVHAILAPTLTASNDPSRSPQSSEVTAQVAAVFEATAAVALQDIRAMNKAQNGRGWNDDGTAYTVDTHATQGVAVAIDTYNQTEHGTAHTIRSGAGMEGVPATYTAMQVRRLTPVECERLQGFPDGYTAIPWRNKPAAECPDGPRYKALGNSWAVPVVRWIGHRIAQGVALSSR